MHRSLRTLLAVPLSLGLSSCEATTQSTPESPSFGTLNGAHRTRGPSVPSLNVPSGTVGPFLLPAAGGWLAVWSAPEADGNASWEAGNFFVDGRMTAAPVRLAAADDGLDLVRFRQLRPGVSLVVASHVNDQSTGLTTLTVSSDATLLSGPTALADGDHRVLWIDIAPTSTGALVAWAEESTDRAEVFAVRVNEDGHVMTPKSRLSANARAWQLVATNQGATVGIVTVDGNIEIAHVDASGTASTPKVLSDQHSAESDIDLTRLGDSVLVAFSDRRVLEPHLFSAVLSSDGLLQSEVRLMRPPLGAQSLVGLESGPQGTVVMWQNFAQEPQQYRIALVGPDGTAPGPSLVVPLTDRSPADGPQRPAAAPQLVSTSNGITLFAPACEPGSTCSETNSATIIDVGPDLSPRAAFDWFGGEDSPDLIWDFQCGPMACAALAAYFNNPAQVVVRTTRTPGRKVELKAFLDAGPDQPGPQTLALQAVIPTPELADVRSVPLGGGTLIAWLSAFDPNIPYTTPTTPAPDGRKAPIRAQLRTHWVPTTSAARTARVDSSEERSVSIRARSVAGINLVSDGPRALLTWTAIDNQKPQVFNTLLDPRGRKLRQEMLTRQSGEVLALSSVAWKSGWVTGWIREDKGRTRAYLARLGATLGRTSADVLVSEGEGLQSALELAATAERVWAVVAEVQGTSEGLKWLTLDPLTLAPSKQTAPFPIPEEAGWQRSSPRLQSWGEGLALAWLEYSADSYRLRFAELNANGGVVRSYLAPLDGQPAALTLRCDAECRLVVSLQTDSNEATPVGTLVGVSVPAAAQAASGAPSVLQLTALAHVSSLPALNVPGSVTDSGLVYFDAGTDAFVSERTPSQAEPGDPTTLDQAALDSQSLVSPSGASSYSNGALHEAWLNWDRK